MKRALQLTLGLTVLATLAGVFILSSVAAPPADAAGCIRCRCLTGIVETAVMSADGPTCAAARANLYQILENAAGCDSFCYEELVITMACTPNGGGGYWVMGKLRYQCELCLDLCQ